MTKRATDWDRHDSGIEPGAVVPPRTDAETDSSVLVIIRRVRRQLTLGFLILVLGIIGAFKANNYEVCQGRADSVQQINSTIGGILTRLNDANRLQYEKGSLSLPEREVARAFYEGEMQQLPAVPSCKVV